MITSSVSSDAFRDATGAQRVIVTHGNVPVMVRYLSEQGLSAEAFTTEFGDDDDGTGAAAEVTA